MDGELWLILHELARMCMLMNGWMSFHNVFQQRVGGHSIQQVSLSSSKVMWRATILWLSLIPYRLFLMGFREAVFSHAPGLNYP